MKSRALLSHEGDATFWLRFNDELNEGKRENEGIF